MWYDEDGFQRPSSLLVWRLQHAENRCEDRPNDDCDGNAVCVKVNLP